MLVFNQDTAQVQISVPNAPGQAATTYTFPGRGLVDIGEGLTHRNSAAQQFTGLPGTYGTVIENLTAGRVVPLDHQRDDIRQRARRGGLLRDTDDIDELKDVALAHPPHYQRITAPRIVMRQGVRFDNLNTPFDIRANGDALLVGVQDLRDITLSVVQATDAGEVDLALEHSPDGVVWVPFATYTEASFAVGDGAAVWSSFSLAANGQSLVTAYFRLRATAFDVAGGVYRLVVSGLQQVRA